MTKFTDSIKKPYVYTGGEYGVPTINTNADVRFCMCVSDSYEVGMSNLGVRILYYMFNSMQGVSCERCFAPWQDYANHLKSTNAPLCSLETGTPLVNFDFVGFSMQFEMCYSNFFYMLELANIPVQTAQRTSDHPFVVAGGPCAVNLEPLYKYLDFVFVGEGETVWTDIVNDYKRMKGNVDRQQFLQYLHQTYDCIYVPSLQGVEYQDGKVVSVGSKIVKRNVVADLNQAFTPNTQLVSNVELVHDRAVLELFRGCANGCRFCQAGFIYRPVRERTVDNAFSLCTQLLQNTGYDELSLNSLSTGDYSGLSQLLDKLLPYAKANNVQLNLPSLRVDTFKGDYASGNRKSSLTFAPEAGTQRLRDVINKNVTEEEILSAAASAFMQGYSSVKLYFMMGLPTETQEDIDGIYDLVVKIKSLYKKHKTSAKALRISVSCSTFIPKPFTPFQWEAFASRDYVTRNQRYLAEKFRQKGIAFSYNDYDVSLMEAILARGGRQIADALYLAYQKGSLFDAWSEHFCWENYRQAFEETGVDINAIVGKKGTSELLPWDYVDVGVQKLHFLCERNRAYALQTTPTCNQLCRACGLHKWGFCQTSHGNVSKEGK
ncbi:MAG: TIGR03960 family B12-binding radical SAM protein [Clostridia bacterium]|nr:TIGR03960 family B12-binding radical SAM protein [Clostridia bacterium]